MSTEESKAIARRMMDMLNRHDQAGVVELCAEDSVFHGYDQHALDRKGFGRNMEQIFKAFPDMHFRVDDLFGEDNKVAVRHYMEGTNQGEYMGMAATGKPVSVFSNATFVIEGGKVKELWLNADYVGMMSQLGLISMDTPPAQAAS